MNEAIETPLIPAPSAPQVNPTEQGAAPNAPVDPMAVVAPAFTDQTAAVQRLESEVAELKTKLLQAELERIVKEAAKSPASNSETGRQQEARRTKAIAAVGGNAKWYSLPVTDRLRAIGEPPTTPEETAEAGRYFGSKSSSADAAILAKHNPGRYARLRLVARESGIL